MQASYSVERRGYGNWRLILHVNDSWQNEWQYNTQGEALDAWNEANAYLEKHGRPPVEDM